MEKREKRYLIKLTCRCFIMPKCFYRISLKCLTWKIQYSPFAIRRSPFCTVFVIIRNVNYDLLRYTEVFVLSFVPFSLLLKFCLIWLVLTNHLFQSLYLWATKAKKSITCNFIVFKTQFFICVFFIILLCIKFVN